MFKLWLIAASVALADAPPLPPGTLPLYVEDPVLPWNPDDPAGFACFGACGSKCSCVDRQDGVTSTCFRGERCDWTTTKCKTHSFCTWHDGCYRSCDFQLPGHVGDGSLARFSCYRACDRACIDGSDVVPPGGSWQPASLDPGAPPEALGLAMCTRRLLFWDDVPYDGELTFAGLVRCTPDPACAR